MYFLSPGVSRRFSSAISGVSAVFRGLRGIHGWIRSLADAGKGMRFHHPLPNYALVPTSPPRAAGVGTRVLSTKEIAEDRCPVKLTYQFADARPIGALPVARLFSLLFLGYLRTPACKLLDQIGQRERRPVRRSASYGGQAENGLRVGISLNPPATL